MSKQPPTTATTTVTKAVGLILATAGKSRSDLARLLGLNPSAITRRFQRGSWSIEEMETICGQVGAPITVLFDPDALGRFLAERTRGASDLGEPSTKWYAAASTRDLVAA